MLVATPKEPEVIQSQANDVAVAIASTLLSQRADFYKAIQEALSRHGQHHTAKWFKALAQDAGD